MIKQKSKYEINREKRVIKITQYIVNRKIKYDRLLHGITPEGISQLFESVKRKVINNLSGGCE